MMATHSKRAYSETERAAMYGVVASTIREAMTRKKWTIGDLNKAIGRPPGHTGLYQWINGKGAPGPAFRARIAKALGVPQDRLQRRKVEGAVAVAGNPGTALVRLPGPQAGRPAEILQFAILADGSSRLRVDVTATAERGVALLRILLDAGWIVATG
jgi:transcriptional regulator with XRE-family HTH domain